MVVTDLKDAGVRRASLESGSFELGMEQRRMGVPQLNHDQDVTIAFVNVRIDGTELRDDPVKDC